MPDTSLPQPTWAGTCNLTKLVTTYIPVLGIGQAMYFPQFLVGMLTSSGVVGAWVYVATGSVWKAVAWSIIAAVLLQVGYFALVFRLVYGRRRDMKQEHIDEATPVRPSAASPRRRRHSRG